MAEPVLVGYGSESGRDVQRCPGFVSAMVAEKVESPDSSQAEARSES